MRCAIVPCVMTCALPISVLYLVDLMARFTSGRKRKGAKGIKRIAPKLDGTSSLSDLTLIYCGKAEVGQIFRSFSLKGPAIRLKRAKNRKPGSECTFPEIGRAHVCTPVTNAHLVCRLLLA